MTVSITGGLLGFSTSGAGGQTLIMGEVDYFAQTTADSASFAGNVIIPSFTPFGGTKLTSMSSSNSQMVTCPTGGTATQYCDAAGAWVAGPTITTGTPTVGQTACIKTRWPARSCWVLFYCSGCWWGMYL